MTKRFLTLIILSTFLSACAPAFDWDASSNPEASRLSDPSTSLSMCSALTLEGISWPAEFSETEKVILSVAMNVSGSFEGSDGWSNLTNNFDGQGLSFGLFNQTLGTGSLQPMLEKMRSNANEQMRSVFSSKNFNSISGMITNWQENRSTSRAVNWAVNTLYNGDYFKSDWSQQLRSLAVTPYYRSLQVEAATAYHDRALYYMSLFGTTELRSYLFFFDIVVQNGSVPSAVVNNLTKKFSKSVYTDVQKMNDVLSGLLPYVISTYREDVRSRKASIINQSGVVHGTSRKYNKEYCTDLAKNI